jgi:hypothetical protein
MADRQRPWTTIIHYAVVGILVIGGGLYWLLKPPSVNPLSDPRAAEAMALVQTHRALGAPSIRQAIDQHARLVAARGRGVRVGEWMVERERPEVYRVRILLREEGSVEWIERSYVWRVDVAQKIIRPLTIAATGIMPVDPESSSRLLDRDQHMDEAVGNLGAIARHANLRVFRSCSGSDVVAPTVPRTLDKRPVEAALAKRPPRVRAGIVQRIDRPIDVAERDAETAGFNCRTLPGRKV